jgi:hypothetical protein
MYCLANFCCYDCTQSCQLIHTRHSVRARVISLSPPALQYIAGRRWRMNKNGVEHATEMIVLPACLSDTDCIKSDAYSHTLRPLSEPSPKSWKLLSVNCTYVTCVLRTRLRQNCNSQLVKQLRVKLTSSYFEQNLKGSADGAYPKSLGLWALSIARNPKYWNTRRFGNWTCFRPQERGGRHLLWTSDWG